MSDSSPSNLWSAVGRVLNNIHGTDAALIIICFVMWQLNTTKKLDQELAIHTLDCMLWLGISIVVGRVVLSLIHSLRLGGK